MLILLLEKKRQTAVSRLTLESVVVLVTNDGITKLPVAFRENDFSLKIYGCRESK